MRNGVIHRFLASFVANFCRMGISVFTGLVVARGLGVERFGDLNFLLASFAAISQLVEMGSASAFYTLISRRPRERTFFGVYVVWVSIQFVIIAALVLFLPSQLFGRVWFDHQRGIVLMALAATFFSTQIWALISQLSEALRKTVLIQTVSVVQAAAHLLLIAALIYLKALSVWTVLLLLVLEYAVIALILGPRLILGNINPSAIRQDSTAILKEFVTYCTPLVVYAGAGFLYAFADRWFLQLYGGSQQQGFFSLSQQISSVSLIATTSMSRVFWKEVAEARHLENHSRVTALYDNVLRGLYFASAWLSCLLIPYSRELLRTFLGPSFEPAWLAFSIMLIYPIHQSIGQVTGSFLWASADTGMYARVGIATMLVGVPVTYFLLAPPNARIPGFSLGATGLALKLVVLQLLAVNVQMFFIARKDRTQSHISYQFFVLLLLLGLSALCKAGVDFLFKLVWPGAPTLGIAAAGGLAYIAISLSGIAVAPGLLGMSRDQLRIAISRVGSALMPSQA